MAKKIGVEYYPNVPGIRSLMRSKHMQGVMIGYAQEIADAAMAMGSEGAEFTARPANEPVTGIVSAHAFARTENYRAMLDEAYHHTLSKALRSI